MADQTERKRLADVLPPEFLAGGYEATPAMRHASMDVIGVHHTSERPWPGPQKSVSEWYALANGKAVGVMRKGERLSLPVVSYNEPPARPTVPILLQFTSVLHQKLHDVLGDFGFDFQVSSSNYMVGFEYRHPDKRVTVVLAVEDDELGYVCCKPDQTAYAAQDYNRPEWHYISATGISEEERLRRDLHVLIKVRPAHLLRVPQT
jgi:hypothetical protein